MSRALSIGQLLRKKFRTIPFTGVWREALGEPERNGSWIIWGHSGNGKTRFSLMLAKELSQFGRVAYNTLEEGARLSFQQALKEADMRLSEGRFMILNREPMSELRKRLAKRKSPDFIFIDSVQYSFLNRRAYFDLKNEFPGKLFIFVSHANGNDPDGDLAKKIRYDADVKIWIEGYKAFPTSRYGGGEPIVIWPEEAEIYWGKTIEDD